MSLKLYDRAPHDEAIIPFLEQHLMGNPSAWTPGYGSWQIFMELHKLGYTIVKRSPEIDKVAVIRDTRCE